MFAPMFPYITINLQFMRPGYWKPVKKPKATMVFGKLTSIPRMAWWNSTQVDGALFPIPPTRDSITLRIIPTNYSLLPTKKQHPWKLTGITRRGPMELIITALPSASQRIGFGLKHLSERRFLWKKTSPSPPKPHPSLNRHPAFPENGS